MTREQQDRAFSERHDFALCATPDEIWPADGETEPPLDALLDDTIMRLLWRADRLEPAKARATVFGLQALVRRTNRARPDHGSAGARQRRSLAA